MYLFVLTCYLDNSWQTITPAAIARTSVPARYPDDMFSFRGGEIVVHKGKCQQEHNRLLYIFSQTTLTTYFKSFKHPSAPKCLHTEPFLFFLIFL